MMQLKKRLFLLFVSFLMVGTASSQTKRVQKRVDIKVPVECASCQNIIERYFKREPGIIRMQISYRKNLVRVTYRSDRTSASQIRNTIAYLGFDADTVKANPESQKRLPPCCRPEKVQSTRQEKAQKEEKGKAKEKAKKEDFPQKNDEEYK